MTENVQEDQTWWNLLKKEPFLKRIWVLWDELSLRQKRELSMIAKALTKCPTRQVGGARGRRNVAQTRKRRNGVGCR